MKKIIAIILSLVWITSFNTYSQTGKVRYLQVNEGDKTVRLAVDEQTPYSIKTEMTDEGTLMVMVYKGGELIAIYPEGTKIYPKYDDPDAFGVTETIVSNDVVVYTPANGITLEENIIEYIPNQKVVFSVPEVQPSSSKLRSVSAVGAKFKLNNFNTNMSTDLFPGMCISIPPNAFVPEGGLMKVTEVQYGQGSVIVWGEQASLNDVLLTANIDSKISFFDNFNKTSFIIPTNVEGLTLKVTCDKIDEKKTISVSVTATYNLLHNEPQKEPDKSATSAKANVSVEGKLELRNAILTPRIIKPKGQLLPDVCDFTLEGELNASITGTVDVNIKEEIGKTFRVGTIPLGVILIPGTPIYISPKLALDIELGAKGSLSWKWKCLDYTYPFSFAAGYYEGDWYTQGNENKGYFTYHDFPSAMPDIKGSVYEDIKLGLVCHFMEWQGVEAFVGGGIKPGIDFTYKAENKELEIDINAPLYAFCEFSFNTLFGTELKWGPIERNLVDWHLWNAKITVDTEEPPVTEESVVINGVRWATRNVGAPGTFVQNPEDAGMFYQWNRKIGWSSTDPMVDSNGGTEWDITVPSGTIWEKANDPSPAGWRVPTREEFGKLLDTDKVDSEWVSMNGIYGRKFTDKSSGNSLFLPAANYRNHSDGTLPNLFSGGRYWSSIPYELYGVTAYILSFHSEGAYWVHGNRRNGFSVRSVAE